MAWETTQSRSVYENQWIQAPEHVFLACGLSLADATGHHEEGISDVRAVPLPEVLAMVANGSITDGETIAALMYAAIHLGRVH